MTLKEFSEGRKNLVIREARIDDAIPACDVVRASIVELCFADHDGDRGLLAIWLANKTPDNLRVWIAQSHVFIAEREGMMAGVAGITGSGEITLNYVSPAHRFAGVSRALLLAVEERARDLGLDHCTLESTKTSLAFYRAAGYQDVDGPRGKARLIKRL